MPEKPQNIIQKILNNPNLGNYITVLVTLTGIVSSLIFAVHWFFTVENAMNDLNELKKTQETFGKELMDVKTELGVQIKLSERERERESDREIKSNNKEKISK